MAKTLSEQEILRLARLGALARLRELEDEAQAIRRMFPGLAGRGEGTAEGEAKPRKGKAKGGRGHMSPEARKAAAERMKAYWAKKKGLTSVEGETPAEASETAADAVRRKPRARKRGGRKRR